LTKELNEGETDIVQGDMEIGVRAILTNQREGIAEFYLGADKVKLTDTTYTDDSYAASGVEIGGETINDAKVKMKASNLAASKISISSIYYQIKADPAVGSTAIFIPPGHGLKEYMEEPAAMLNPNWDIKYEGLKDVATTPLIFQASGDDAYNLEFTNVNGAEYDVPLVDNSQGTMVVGAYGDGELWWMETNSTTNCSRANNFRISEGDYIVVSDRNDDQGVTVVLQYEDIDTTNKKVTFSDLAGGSIEGTYTAAASTDYTTFNTNCAVKTGTFNVGGNTYNMYICGNESMGYNLSIDHDGDGTVTYGKKINITTKGGAIINFNVSTQGQLDGNVTVVGDAISAKVIIPQRLFDEQGPYTTGGRLASNQDLNTSIDIEMRASNEVGLGFDDTPYVTMERDQDNNDYKYALDPYGAFWTKYDPSGSTSAETITVDMPAQQRGAEVFVTAGAVTTSKASTGGDGAVMVNTAAVGIGVLDSDVRLGQGNLIVVGGPCVNTIAMELMGNPEECAEGFEPGKAVIKLYEDQNALLVAGHGWEDTLGAAYVLADYEDYDMAGTELEVVVADLDTITVNRVE
jgi:hypothetical protein